MITSSDRGLTPSQKTDRKGPEPSSRLPTKSRKCITKKFCPAALEVVFTLLSPTVGAWTKAPLFALYTVHSSSGHNSSS